MFSKTIIERLAETAYIYTAHSLAHIKKSGDEIAYIYIYIRRISRRISLFQLQICKGFAAARLEAAGGGRVAGHCAAHRRPRKPWENPAVKKGLAHTRRISRNELQEALGWFH